MAYVNRPGLTFPQPPRRPPPQVPAAEQLLKKLLENVNFDYYSAIIHDQLHASDDKWHIITQIRSEPFFLKHFPATTQVPPEDIFQTITDLRNTPEWRPGSTETNQILHRVASRRIGQYLSPPPPPRQTTRPISLQSSSRYYSNPSSSAYPASTDLQSVHYTESVHTDSASVSRTAPDGCKFFCGSMNCDKNFTRLGDYQNHMARWHPDCPIRDPRTALKRISQSSVTTPLHQPDHMFLQTQTLNAPNDAPNNPFVYTTSSATPNTQGQPRPETVEPEVVQATGEGIYINPRDLTNTGHLTPPVPRYLFGEYIDVLDPGNLFPNGSAPNYTPGQQDYEHDMPMTQ